MKSATSLTQSGQSISANKLSGFGAATLALGAASLAAATLGLQRSDDPFHQHSEA